jgi:hypothetical protein
MTATMHTARATVTADLGGAPDFTVAGPSRLVPWLVRDPRDLPLFRTALALLGLVAIPGWGLIAIAPLVPWWAYLPVAIGFGFFVPLFMARGFVNVTHWNSHHRILAKRFQFLEGVYFWGVGPFVGLPGELYEQHHMAMHHPWFQTLTDLSNPGRFRRDGPVAFARYAFDFSIVQTFRVPWQLARHGRVRQALRYAASDWTWMLGTLAVGLFWSPLAAIFGMLMPAMATRLLLACGNWAEHGFINPTDIATGYGCTTTCINTDGERFSFNDGYHLSHHLRPAMHWSDTRAHTFAHMDDLKDHDAIVFDGLSHFELWKCLMKCDYVGLAKHYVNLRGRSDDEIVSLLQARAQVVLPKAAPQRG